MILRGFCWLIFLCLALGPTVKAQVTVDEQGYQNVLITFASNVPSKDGKKILENLQDLLKDTSGVLHKAIGKRIASVTFLLPPSWSTKTWNNITISPASSQQTDRKPDIRVDAAERSPFGKQPSALQYGGCGVPGHQITLPLDFLNSTEEYPKGRILAREWLKYRYGVFSENGYLNDNLYPEYYRISGGSYTSPRTDIRIPDCTNSKVTYTFKKPVPKDTRPCNMDSSVGDYGYCKPYPDEKSAANVTSSLMFYHNHLPNMEHVCGKDGMPHNSEAKNKQNVLCNGRSIWDVIKSSDDFKTTRRQSVDANTEPLKFSYIQEKPTSRFVVLLENSDKLHEKEVPSAVRFAVRRFYYDLLSKSKLAIYTYNSDVTEAFPFTELPDFFRTDLGNFVDFGTPATSICTSCGLAKAAEKLLQDSEVENGTILLLTASPLDKVPELSEKLKQSGICLHVLRFTDKNNPADQSYDPLANSFSCFSQESLQMSLDVVDIFNNVLRFLTNDIAELGEDVEINTVAYGNISAQIPVTISGDSTAEGYIVWLGRALQNTSIECKEGNTIVELKPETTATDIASFAFSPKSNDDEVTCRLVSTKQAPALIQVTMVTLDGHFFDFDTWIHDVSTSEKQLPIIVYAKLFSKGYPIKYADVKMVVKSEKNPDVVVKMLDNGLGDPDITQYDGIYSAYFSDFLDAGKYLISVTIGDNNKEAMIGKGTESTPSTCCGRSVNNEDFDMPVPTFKKEKHFVYEARNKRPKDGYTPNRILNFQAVAFPSEKVVLVAPAPGGGKATRFDIKFFLNREDAVSNFDNTGMDLNTSSLVITEAEKAIRLTVPFKDLEIGTTYYAAIRSWNDFNKSSEISNVAEFIVPKREVETTTMPPSTTEDGSNQHDPPKSTNKTLGIVLGVLGGIAVLCALAFLGYYFFVRKPRRGNQ